MSDQQAAFREAAAYCANKFSKKDDAVLYYKTIAGADIYHFYDFITRNLYIRFESKDHSHIIPFRDVDPETLNYMRDKLIELGGNPPPLPAARDPFNPIRKGP